MRSLGNPHMGDIVFRSLWGRYAESHRAYHNIRRIISMLDELYRLNESHGDQAVLGLGVWYHNAIYDPRSESNEAKSVVVATMDIKALRQSVSLGEKVTRLIMATQHKVAPANHLSRTIADLDLMILGAPPEAFDAYERAIRKEYSWMPEAKFRAERSRVLRSFFERPKVYLTQRFQEKFEAAAQGNLERSLLCLKA